MFLAALAGVGGFKRADGLRDVAGEDDADGASFGGDGEISFARNAVVDLQEIDAGVGQRVAPRNGRLRRSRLRTLRAAGAPFHSMGGPSIKPGATICGTSRDKLPRARQDWITEWGCR